MAEQLASHAWTACPAFKVFLIRIRWEHHVAAPHGQCWGQGATPPVASAHRPLQCKLCTFAVREDGVGARAPRWWRLGPRRGRGGGRPTRAWGSSVHRRAVHTLARRVDVGTGAAPWVHAQSERRQSAQAGARG